MVTGKALDMINLEFHLADGTSVIVYDVHPRSQEVAIGVPLNTVSVRVWMGTRPGNGVQ